MARLRQQYPQNYLSSGNISVEFESLIRYINAAEVGNRTLAELLESIFNSDGDFAGPIEMRYDSVAGLQFRVGIYDVDTDGWQTITDAANVRGAPGRDAGSINSPLFYGRRDSVATAGQTVFTHIFDDETDTVVVYVNGLLQRADGTVYTTNAVADTITFITPRTLSDVVVSFSIRKSTPSVYRRTQTTATGGQVIFSYAHSGSDTILVYRNGLLQRLTADYTTNPDAGTVTMVSGAVGGDVYTFMTTENTALTSLGGLMLEDRYAPGGSILYTKLSIADGQIPQAKVSGLSSGLAAKPKMTLSATAPVSPTSGDLWVDTSVTPSRLQFWDGVSWIQTNPSSSLPSFSISNALQQVRVNASGTGLEYAAIDFSALVPKTFIGASNGVAALDSTGKLPTSQLPAIYSSQTIQGRLDGSVTNVTILVARLYKQRVRLDGITRRLSAGTCSIQLSVDGVTVGSVHAVTTTGTDTVFGSPIEIDATAVSRRLEIVITSAAAASNLEVGLAAANLSV